MSIGYVGPGTKGTLWKSYICLSQLRQKMCFLSSILLKGLSLKKNLKEEKCSFLNINKNKYTKIKGFLKYFSNKKTD